MTPRLARAALRKAGVTLVPVVNTTSGRSGARTALAAPVQGPGGPVDRVSVGKAVVERGSVVAAFYASLGPIVAMILDLPEPPSANRYWRVYRGRVVVSAEATRYKALVIVEAMRVRHRPFGKDVPVAVTLNWFRGKRMGDLDNRIKVTLDALRGVLYADDKQVVEIHAFRSDDPRKGRLTVKVERKDIP